LHRLLRFSFFIAFGLLGLGFNGAFHPLEQSHIQQCRPVTTLTSPRVLGCAAHVKKIETVMSWFNSPQ
jgi:hypothetical protein